MKILCSVRIIGVFLLVLLCWPIHLQGLGIEQIFWEKAVYGEDNRKEIYQVHNPHIQKLARSIGAMFFSRDLYRSSGQNYSIKNKSSLGRKFALCPNERFREQPAVSRCTGFLVATDILVTAGHCYAGLTESEEGNTYWIFDYKIDSTSHFNLDQIPADQVFKTKKVLKKMHNGYYDFAIVQLVRKARGRRPLSLRSSGKVTKGESLFILGHPLGLPLKYSDQAMVMTDQEVTTFTTNLDSFIGNSGSAVFNQKTYQVEGILIKGRQDFILDKQRDGTNCYRLNTCDQYSRKCSLEEAVEKEGESVMRIREIAPYLRP